MANFYSCDTWFKKWDNDLAVIEGKIKADSNLNGLTIFLYDSSERKKWRRHYSGKLYREFSWEERFSGLKGNYRYQVYFYEGDKKDFDPYDYDWKCYTSFKTAEKPTPTPTPSPTPTPPARGNIHIENIEKSGSEVRVKFKVSNVQTHYTYYIAMCEDGALKGTIAFTPISDPDYGYGYFTPDKWKDGLYLYLYNYYVSECNWRKALDYDFETYDLAPTPTPTPPPPKTGEISITGFEKSDSTVKVNVKLTKLKKGETYWITACENGVEKSISVLADVDEEEESVIYFLPDKWKDSCCVLLWGELPDVGDRCSTSKAISYDCESYDLEEGTPLPVTEDMTASFKGWTDDTCYVKIELSGLYKDIAYRVCIWQNDEKLHESSFWGTSDGEKELIVRIEPVETEKNVEILLFREKSKCYKPSDYMHIVYTACYIPKKEVKAEFEDVWFSWEQVEAEVGEVLYVHAKVKVDGEGSIKVDVKRGTNIVGSTTKTLSSGTHTIEVETSITDRETETILLDISLYADDKLVDAWGLRIPAPTRFAVHVTEVPEGGVDVACCKCLAKTSSNYCICLLYTSPSPRD